MSNRFTCSGMQVQMLHCYLVTLRSMKLKMHSSTAATVARSSRHTHTLFWLVGNIPTNRQYFLMGDTSAFIERSGLHVEVKDLSNCSEQREATQQLKITPSSAEMFNRTAIQCVAIRTGVHLVTLTTTVHMQ